jgi:PKD repeat protein
VAQNTRHAMFSIFLVSLLMLSVSRGMVRTHTEGSISEGGSEAEFPDSVTTSGTRNGGNITVLLINSSDESAPIFNDVISANDTYDLTEVGEGETDPDTWGGYDILVWSQGRKDANASLETELREYVLAGGHLVIEGANIADQASSTDFENDVLHANSIDGIPTPASHYVGQNLTTNGGDHPIATNPVMLSDPLTYISDGSHGLDSDVCSPENGSVVALEWDNVTTVNGATNDNSNNYGGAITFDDDSNFSNGGQIVFLSFGIALVNGTADRIDLVENIMDWLIPSEKEFYYAFYLSPDSQDQNTNSGGTAIYDILVTNNGTLDDTIDLFRTAPPAGWSATLNQTAVTVAAGDSTSISLTVTAPVSAQNGDYANISVWGESQGNGDLTYLVYANTTVNNEARADLEPITLGPDRGLMLLGDETTISSIIRNNGDRDANNVIVTFFLDNNASIPIGNDTIDVPAESESKAEIVWNATSSFGDHLLIVEVDPGQNHPESDETNNDLENSTRDWEVRGMAEHMDAEYILTGNVFVVGTYKLDNVTLQLNSTDGTYGIYVSLSGSLEAFGSHFSSVGSDTDETFRFQTRGVLLLTECELTSLYFNGDLGDPRGGLEVYSSSCDIIDSTFNDTAMGVWTSVAPTIEGSMFTNLTHFGIYAFGSGSSPTINQSSFTNMITAITLRDGGGTVMGSMITEANTGIYLGQGSGAMITGNTIHDLTGQRRGIFVVDSSPLILDNIIHSTNVAIWVEGLDSMPFISGNDLSNNDHYSAYSDDGRPIFERNIVSGNGNVGFNLNGGEVVIRHMDISDNQNKGILAYRTDLTIENVTIIGNDDPAYDEGIFSYGSTIRFLNSSFRSFTIDLDMNLTHTTYLTSLNSSYETVNRTGESIISNGWFVTIKAIDRSGAPVQNGTVVITDVDGNVIYRGRTDSTGHVTSVPVVMYNVTDDGDVWFAEHTIHIDNGGGNGNDTVNFTENQYIELVVNSPPTAILKVNKIEGSSDTIFLFNGEESTDDSYSIDVFLFDFGDGETTGWIDRDDASHTYQYAGIYTASLTVKDHDGAVSDPATIQITINNPPVVNLPDELDGKENVDINFEADVYDPDSWDNLHYEWNFDDGTTSTLINPTHAYEETGTYIVVLTVTDDHGAFGDDLMTVEIFRNRPPTADAGEDINVTFNNGAQVQFRSYSEDDDNDPLTYNWDFDDGSSSQQEAPNHFYSEAGTYNVTLTITDDSGENDTDIVQVNVIRYRITFPKEPVLVLQREDIQGYSFQLLNNGSHPVLVNLTTLGSWMYISIENITLDVGEERSVYIRFTVPKNADMDISEQILLAEAGGEEFRGSIFIDVQKEAGVSLAVQSPARQSGDPGDVLSYTVKLSNTGSDIDSFRIQVSSFPPGWTVLVNGLVSAILENIGPDSDAYISVEITIPEEEVAGLKTVTIIASSVTDPSKTSTKDIQTTVNSSPEPGTEGGNSNLLIGIGLLLLIVLLGVIFQSRKNQNLKFAEDDEEDFDDWDDGPVGKPSAQQRSRQAPPKVKPRILKCPKCATLLEVPSAKRPITIECPGCGARAHIKK